MRLEVVSRGCPSRGLLRLCAETRGEDPLQLYQRLLADCISPGHSASAVAVLEPDLAERFYGSDDSDRPPRFCSLEDVAHLAHLKLVSEVPFVVYQLLERKGVEFLVRIFDNRVLLGLWSEVKQPEVSLVLSEGCSKLSSLVGGEQGLDPYDLKKLNYGIAERPDCCVTVGNCLLTAAGRLLGSDLESWAGKSGWDLPQLFNRSQEAWRLLGKDFLLVEHIGCKPWKKGVVRPQRWERQRFKILVAVYDRESGSCYERPGTPVLALSYHGHLTRLSRKCSEKVLLSRRPDDLSSIGNRLQVSGPLQGLTPAEQFDELSFKASMGGGDANDEGQGPGEKDFRKMTPCGCKMCEECSKYGGNMEIGGSQKLYTVEWDLLSFLKFFALDSESNVRSVRECFRLSVSGMDLETTTVPLGFRVPGLSPEQECKLREPPELISSAPRAGAFDECAQRILLIGHIDNIFQDASMSKGCSKIFETPRTSSGVRDSVHAYVEYVLSRQAEMESRKRVLLGPLARFVASHKEAFFDYFELKEVPAKVAAASWKASVFGKFESRVEALCKKYYVYAFNGAGFDFPLLCGHIATAPWVREQWRVQRSGSSVTMISLPRRRIYFRGESAATAAAAAAAALSSSSLFSLFLLQT